MAPTPSGHDLGGPILDHLCGVQGDDDAGWYFHCYYENVSGKRHKRLRDASREARQHEQEDLGEPDSRPTNPFRPEKPVCWPQRPKHPAAFL